MPDLTVNGESHTFDAEVGRTLAETLRDDLGLYKLEIARTLVRRALEQIR